MLLAVCRYRFLALGQRSAAWVHDTRCSERQVTHLLLQALPLPFLALQMLLPSSALPGLLALSLQLPLSALQRGLQGSSSTLGQSMRKDCGS